MSRGAREAIAVHALEKLQKECEEALNALARGRHLDAAHLLELHITHLGQIKDLIGASRRSPSPAGIRLKQ